MAHRKIRGEKTFHVGGIGGVKGGDDYGAEKGFHIKMAGHSQNAHRRGACTGSDFPDMTSGAVHAHRWQPPKVRHQAARRLSGIQIIGVSFISRNYFTARARLVKP